MAYRHTDTSNSVLQVSESASLGRKCCPCNQRTKKKQKQTKKQQQEEKQNHEQVPNERKVAAEGTKVKMVKVKMMVKTILHLHLREHEIPQSLGRGYQVPVWTLLGLLLLVVVVVVVVQTQV